MELEEFPAVNCLPIIERELRAKCRRRATYMLRAFVAGAGMLAIVLAVMETRRPDRGMAMLMGIACVGMVVTQFSGCFFTADCVSSEKREGTLGLLFLTPLRSLDIVVGKLVSHSLLVFFSMLALAPVLFIPLLHGGVTGGETLRVMISLVVSLFLSLSVGVFVSILGRDARSTVMGTFVFLAALHLLPLLYLFIVGEMVRGSPSPYGPPQFAPWALPFFAMEQTSSRFGGSLFPGALAIQTSIGAVALFAGAHALRRIARRGDFDWESANPLAPGRWSRFWRWAAQRTRRRAGSPGSQQPYFWAARRGWSEVFWLRWLRRTVWLGVGIFFVSSMFVNRSAADELLGVTFFFAIGLHWVTKFMLILDATRQLSEDRRSGCLELVLSTRLTDQQVMAGATRAVQDVFRFRIWSLAALNGAICVAVVGFSRHYHMGNREEFVFSVVLIGGGLAALSDFRAIVWHGALSAMRRTTHLKAVFVTFATVLIAPLMVFVVIMFASAEMRLSVRGLGAVMMSWFAACYAYNFWLTRRSRRKLTEGFRRMAAGGK